MGKKKKENIIDTGLNLYDFNKKGMELYKELSFGEVHSKFLEQLDMFSESKYIMLLNKERSDYTIFYLKDGHLDKHLLADNLYETLNNRGKVIDITPVNGNALEIWIRDGEENFLYMLFDYSTAIVEV